MIVFVTTAPAALFAQDKGEVPLAQDKGEAPSKAIEDKAGALEKSPSDEAKKLQERINSGEIMPPEYAGEDIDPNDPRGVAGSLEGIVWPAIKTMLMLLVVLGLIYLSLHKGLGKLISKTQAGKRIQVVERVNLDQKRALFIVKVDGEELFLAASEGGLTPLQIHGQKAFELEQSAKSIKVAETGVRQNGERIKLRKDDDA